MPKVSLGYRPLIRSWGRVRTGLVRTRPAGAGEPSMVSIHSRKLGGGPALPTQRESIDTPPGLA
jgi:hypothetical protein